MQAMMNTNRDTFYIFVDRIEGKFAVCEMPDGTMCDVELECFSDYPQDRERFEVFIDSQGNFKILKKAKPEIPDDKKHKLSSRLIRFS